MSFAKFSADTSATNQLTIREVSVASDRLVLSVTGEVDIATSGELDQALTDLLHRRSPRRLVVDLAGVGFLDSSGLRVLLNGSREAQLQGCRLTLTNVTPPVRRVLEITGVASLFGLDNRDDQPGVPSSPVSTR